MREIYIEVTDNIRLHLVFSSDDLDNTASFTIEKHMEDGGVNDIVAYDIDNYYLLCRMMENDSDCLTNYELDKTIPLNDLGMWEWDDIRGAADIEDAVDALFEFIRKSRPHINITKSYSDI